MANILVVDDAAFMRIMLKDILMKAGHRIIGEAGTGVEAIDQYNVVQAIQAGAKDFIVKADRVLEAVVIALV